MNKVLLISEKTIKKYTLINDNIDGEYLLPAIQMSQDVDLDTTIGTKLNKKIQDLVLTNEINTEANVHYKKLLEEYITPYLCWLVMANVQVAVNYKFTNSGMVENYDENKQRLGYQDSKALSVQYDKYATAYGAKLKDYLIDNSNLYPEYFACDNTDNLQLCAIHLP